MRKIFCLSMILILILSTASCNKTKESDETSASSEQTNSFTTVTPLETLPQETSDTADESTGDDVTETGTDTETEDVSTDTDAPETEYDGTWSFAALDEQIMADDEDWVFTGWKTALYYDGYAGSDAHGSGFTLVNKNYINEKDTYKFEFELSTPRSGDVYDEPNDKALFVGLRQQTDAANATDDDGIWLAFKDKKMCVKGSGDTLLGSLTEFELPYGFDPDFRKIFVEDNQSEGIIKVFLENENGDKVLVCRIEVGHNDSKGVTQLTVYTWKDGFTEKSAVLDCALDIYDGGFVMLWSNNRSQVYIKNAAFKIVR